MRDRDIFFYESLLSMLHQYYLSAIYYVSVLSLSIFQVFFLTCSSHILRYEIPTKMLGYLTIFVSVLIHLLFYIFTLFNTILYGHTKRSGLTSPVVATYPVMPMLIGNRLS